MKRKSAVVVLAAVLAVAFAAVSVSQAQVVRQADRKSRNTPTETVECKLAPPIFVNNAFADAYCCNIPWGDKNDANQYHCIMEKHEITLKINNLVRNKMLSKFPNLDYDTTACATPEQECDVVEHSKGCVKKAIEAMDCRVKVFVELFNMLKIAQCPSSCVGPDCPTGVCPDCPVCGTQSDDGTTCACPDCPVPACAPCPNK